MPARPALALVLNAQQEKSNFPNPARIRRANKLSELILQSFVRNYE
jgi:hypothetical protein